MKRILPLPELTPTEIKHFWSCIRTGSSDACWNWLRYKTPSGYGQVGFRYTLYLAHRIAWFLTTGIDPRGQFVCHSCDNPACCNNAHLFLGDQMANMRDMIVKGRANHSKNLRGSENGSSKLSDEDVRTIWRLHLTEGIGERKLGARFHVTPANIHAILSGQTWKHLIPENTIPLVRPVNGHPRRLLIRTDIPSNA